MKTSHNMIVTLFLILSFLGLVLIVVFANLSPTVQDDAFWRKPLVGASFSVVCLLGVAAGIFPSKCSSMFHFRRAEQKGFTSKSTSPPKTASVLVGHHPDCGNFGTHVFRVGKRIFCAGCVGLILGAVLSLFGVAVYFFLNLSFRSNNFFVFWVGFMGVSCGLLQYHLFNWGRSSIHLAVNTFFVFGVFLLLVGVDAITQNAIVDFYLIALSIFWLYTRILLSQLDHKMICTACREEDCEYTWKKKHGRGALSTPHSIESAGNN